MVKFRHSTPNRCFYTSDAQIEPHITVDLFFTAITSEGTIQLPDGTRVQATSPTGHIVQVSDKADAFVLHVGTN